MRCKYLYRCWETSANGLFPRNRKHIQTAIKTAQSNKWAEEAMARARYHLALLYEERDGKQGEEAKALIAEARKVLDMHKRWTPKVILNAGDDMLILDDMQGTFTGRYTGRALLKYLQGKAREGAVIDLPQWKD